MIRTVTVNRYEFSVRKVDELNEAILLKEQELKSTKGFLNTYLVKLELKKLYKQINLHGEDVIQYEITNAHN